MATISTGKRSAGSRTRDRKPVVDTLDVDRLRHISDDQLHLTLMAGIVRDALRRCLAAYPRRQRRVRHDAMQVAAGLAVHLPDTFSGETRSAYRWKGQKAVFRNHVNFLPYCTTTDQPLTGSGIAELRGRTSVDPPDSSLARSVALANAMLAGIRGTGLQAPPPPLQRPSNAQRNRNLQAGNRTTGRLHSILGQSIAAGLAMRQGEFYHQTGFRRVEERTTSLEPPNSVVRLSHEHTVIGAEGPEPAQKLRAERNDRREAPSLTDDYLAGAEFGRWMLSYLERQMLRPRLGMTGVDPRVTPL